MSTVTTTAPDGTETVLASQIEQAPFGPITSLQHGNGLVETRNLNEAYQVASVTVPGVLARDYAYTVDANVAGIDDLLSSARTQMFGYDPVDRLTAAEGAFGDLVFELETETADCHYHPRRQHPGAGFRYLLRPLPTEVDQIMALFCQHHLPTELYSQASPSVGFCIGGCLP